MTTRVPLVCTPEEFVAAVRIVINGPAWKDRDAMNYPEVAALFRPAEEPAPCDHEWIRTMEDTPEWCRKCLVPKEEAERNTGFDSRSGATLPSSSGAGMANPVAGGRAPGQDALSSAPAAPPPTGEPAWMTSELRKNLDCMVFVDAQVFSQARASMVAAIDHAVLSALAALRAEMKGELEAKA